MVKKPANAPPKRHQRIKAIASHRAKTYDEGILGDDFGFDRIHEPLGACRGCGWPRKKAAKPIVANDETFALAA
jgi:hypothetical protein